MLAGLPLQSCCAPGHKVPAAIAGHYRVRVPARSLHEKKAHLCRYHYANEPFIANCTLCGSYLPSLMRSTLQPTTSPALRHADGVRICSCSYNSPLRCRSSPTRGTRHLQRRRRSKFVSASRRPPVMQPYPCQAGVPGEVQVVLGCHSRTSSCAEVLRAVRRGRVCRLR